MCSINQLECSLNKDWEKSSLGNWIPRMKMLVIRIVQGWNAGCKKKGNVQFYCNWFLVLIPCREDIKAEPGVGREKRGPSFHTGLMGTRSPWKTGHPPKLDYKSKWERPKTGRESLIRTTADYSRYWRQWMEMEAAGCVCVKHLDTHQWLSAKPGFGRKGGSDCRSVCCQGAGRLQKCNRLRQPRDLLFGLACPPGVQLLRSRDPPLYCNCPFSFLSSP